MCLIIRKPAGRQITADFLENVWQRNSDGWGAFHSDGGKVIWAKGLHFDELLRYNEQLPDDTEAFLHLRKATYGQVCHDMAHPYLVREGLLLMHNGSIHHLAPSDPRASDTSELARLLSDMLDGLNDVQARALLRTEGFSRLMAPLVKGSMVILFDADGAVRLGRDWHIVGAEEWDGVMPGIEVSNTHAWCPKSMPDATWWRDAWRRTQGWVQQWLGRGAVAPLR
jgi:hypothetical protein